MKYMSNPKVSVIIPVYNVENYLRKSLDCIINQSLKDIEIICINDGSTDNSLKILEEYAQKDNRIIVIDKENGGVATARHAGMKVAKGDYIAFVDPDDWVDTRMYEEMYSISKEKDLDISICASYSCREKNGVIQKSKGHYSLKGVPKKYFNKVFSNEDVIDDIFKFPATCWCKLHKREFLEKNNIYFQDIRVGEDQLFFFQSFIYAKRIYIINKFLYYYRKNRKDSAMTRKNVPNLSAIQIFYGIEKMLIESGLINKYKIVFINKYLDKAISWIGKVDSYHKEEYYKEFSKLISHIKTNYSDPDKSKNWWDYFDCSMNDNYFWLKLKIYLAKIKCSYGL